MAIKHGRYRIRRSVPVGVFALILLCLACEQQILAQGGARESKPPSTVVGRADGRIVTRPRINIKRPARSVKSNPNPNPNPAITLWVVSNPPHSKVAVNGQVKGETDDAGELEISMIPGVYNLRLTRDGYSASEGVVEITPALGAQQEVEFDLAPAVTSLNVVTDPGGAEVYLNETYKGTSNSDGLLVIEHLIPGQSNRLRVTKIGYAEQANIPITTYNGQISIRLLPDSIRVRVSTEPPESEVYFDDLYKGATNIEAGILIIDQVNPNQSHRLRAKKSGYIEQIKLLPPNTAEASLKLLPDPIVLTIKDIRQQITDGNLVKAFAEYNQVALEAADHPELPRLQDLLLQSLQMRTSETFRRIGAFGLVLPVADVEEMKGLYDHARKWRTNDDAVETFGEYWEMKLAIIDFERSSARSEKESARRNAQSRLLNLNGRNLRNASLLLDFGWAWLRLNDPLNAQKPFTAAEELKPDWAYPHFGKAVIAMQGADQELDKKAKLNRYQQAIEEFTRAVSLKNDFSRAYALRAIAYANVKNFTEAVASGLQATTTDPKSAYAHFALGFAHFQKGGKASYRNAKEEFVRALSGDNSELDQATRNSIQERLALIERKIR